MNDDRSDHTAEDTADASVGGAPEPGPVRTPDPLSAEERAAAFASGRTSVDREAALRAGRTPVPRRVVVWIAASLAVIGLGGVALEHYFGNVGVPTTVTTTTLSTTGAPPAPTPPVAPPIGASLDAFLGLKQIGDAVAPDFQLREPSGASWTLHDQSGKVVVVTFANTGCNDICPVLGAELKDAAALLGPKAGDVEFVVVNTDPNATAVDRSPPALSLTGLDGDPSVHFLTGPLPTLNAVWIAYGVTVTVGRTPAQQTHNNILYFVDPRGRLRSSALPFADENGQGVYSLSPADIQRFAQGIARTAASLVTSP